MSVGARSDPRTKGAAVAHDVKDPGYQAFWLLRIGFTVLPIVMGVDKFFNGLVHWEKYLASWYNDILPGDAFTAMHIIGVVEIAAGILVLLKPRYAAYVVAAWLAGIVLDLVTYSGYYDVALRDFGLMLGALTLARLASKYDAPGLTIDLLRRRG
ncbi:MAG TPA: DoxX family protein [Solirubrobacter sp.]|nr:DoxX family protein [Solirubrobacter sp.]